MSRMTMILNPTAGRGAGARLSGRIARCLESHGVEFELATTRGPGHATELARDAAATGCASVVAVGGDGTANEVLNGLYQAPNGQQGTALGVVPIGTGNDFAFSSGVPLDVEDACQVIARGESKLLDLGWVQADGEEPRYFGNGVGIGFDAIVNIESRKVQHLRGFLLYFVALLRTLAVYYAAPRTWLRVDDAEMEGPLILISIMNGHRIGGGFYTTPDSQMDDGLLDLCVGHKVGRLRMVGFVPQLMTGTHTGDRKVTMMQGQKVTVVSEMPWAAHVDGEIYGVGARHYEIELFPQRLRLLR